LISSSAFVFFHNFIINQKNSHLFEQGLCAIQYSMRITPPTKMYIHKVQFWDWQDVNFYCRKNLEPVCGFSVCCEYLEATHLDILLARNKWGLCVVLYCFFGKVHTFGFEGRYQKVDILILLKLILTAHLWLCYWHCSRNLTKVCCITGVHNHLLQNFYCCEVIMTIISMTICLTHLFDRSKLTEM
jgi:hypothetical protein